MVAASIISPACSFKPSFNIVSFPSAELKIIGVRRNKHCTDCSYLNTIFTVSAAAMMWDFSLP